jgi:hypothetical protein
MVALAWFRGEPVKTTDSAPTIAETKPVGPLHAEDPVRTVSVTISAGNVSDLTERVGLDLGLGFPLWLNPIGSDATRPAPFGAMPQSGPAEPVLKAGGEATFTFAADGDPGGDILHTTRQLLGGVLVETFAASASSVRSRQIGIWPDMRSKSTVERSQPARRTSRRGSCSPRL